MPLNLTEAEYALFEPIARGQSALPTPESVFNLPPVMPTTSYFRRGGSRSGYGSSASRPDLQYTLAEKAAQLRLDQLAEEQAAQMFEWTQQIDPTSPSYPQQRFALASQLPLAARDPRGKAILEAADFAYQQSQRRGPEQSFLERVAMEGVTPEEVELFTEADGTVDTVSLGNIAARRRAERQPKKQERDYGIAEISEALRMIDMLPPTPDREAERNRLKALALQQTQTRWPNEAAAAPASTGGITAAEYEALPKGSRYTAPDGSLRVKR